MKLPQLSVRHCLAIALVAAAPIVLVLAGCVPEFENALADKDTFSLDGRLEGVWSNGKKATIRLTDKAAGIYEWQNEGLPGGSDGVPTPFRLFQSGDLHIACLSKRSVDSTSDSIHLDTEPLTAAVLYELTEDGELKIFDWDEDKLAKAIEGGHLKGTVKRFSTGAVYKVHIQSPSAELREWLKDTGRPAFLARPLFNYKQVPGSDP